MIAGHVFNQHNRLIINTPPVMRAHGRRLLCRDDIISLKWLGFRAAMPNTTVSTMISRDYFAIYTAAARLRR